MNALDRLFSLDLRGRLIIEASAGTGKTWTICALLMRLITETEADVTQMLVVTFTRAATAEMREKIHARLIETLSQLNQPNADDPFIGRLRDRLETLGIGLDVAHNRLVRALSDFDQMMVSTIHGFCRQLLNDHALASFTLFSVEVADSSLADIEAIAADFWRHHLLLPEAPEAPTRLFLQRFTQSAHHFVPEKLAQDFGRFLYKPYVKLDFDPQWQWEEAVKAQETTFERAQNSWQAHGEALTQLLLSGFDKRLRGTYYNKKILPPLVKNTDKLLTSGQFTDGLPKYFERLGIDFLAKEWQSTDTLPFYDDWVAFQRLYEANEQLMQAYEEALCGLVKAFIDYGADTLATKRKQTGKLCQDDLLILTHQALLDQPSLAEKIQQQYPVMIIDESQDIDPIQADIFDCLTTEPGSFFVTVGDPKQAIYSFRGGDLHTYLKNTQQFHGHSQTHSLLTNYRSNARVVTAVNTLFSSEQAFIHHALDYQESEAIDTQGQWVEKGRALPGLHAYLLMPEDEAPLTKTVAQIHAVEVVVQEIVRLLASGEREEMVFHSPASSAEKGTLKGHHLAVLVRTKEEGLNIQRALAKRQIASVMQSDESIFDTQEAHALLHVLSAIRTPHLGTLTTALSTDFFGLTGNELHEKRQDEKQLAPLLDAFHRYHELWQQQGVIVALSQCLNDFDAYRHLMNTTKPERRLTNVRHLLECLQKLQGHQRHSETVYQQYIRLLAHLDADVLSTEDTIVRLESEAHLIQIMTIHKAKGLQFDIVFCPFLWSGARSASKKPFSPIYYHDEADNIRLSLGSTQRDEATQAAEREALAEEMRIAYVALTRAKYASYVVSGWIKDLLNAPIGRLAHHEAVSDIDGTIPDNWDKDHLINDWERLTLHTAGAISFEAIMVSDREAETLQNQKAEIGLSAALGVQARLFKGHLEPLRFSYDFTRLNAHDETIALLPREADPLLENSEKSGIYRLPQGTLIGQCVHSIFEQAMRGRLSPLVMEQLLDQYGVDRQWRETIEQMLENLQQTPLPGYAGAYFRLNEIPIDQKIVEMRFRFPLYGCLKEKLMALAHQYHEPIHLADKTPYELEGMMTGLIDLVVEHQGRYYLLDYKTHYLGDQPTDYSPEKIKAVIDQQGYRLQYLIYLVALHRWLSLRLPQYDYDRHIGGVLYVFTRGMSPRYAPDNGIFYHLPSKAFIQQLDDCLHGITEQELSA